MSDVQLKQSKYMRSAEKVNKSCNLVLECVVTESMMVYPERACEMFTSSQTLFHSDSAFRKQEQYCIVIDVQLSF